MPYQFTYKPNTFSSQISLENTPVFQSDSSGKEKDSETGYYYFGARYYNPDLSMWLSVDPMADKYPSLSPYNYCVWNPMKIVDSNGMEALENDDEWKYNTSTDKLSWVGNKGGKDYQTVDIMTNVCGSEAVTKTVSYNGQIQDMFDFSVISGVGDNIVNGSLQAVGGVMTALGGICVGVGSGGFATAVGGAMVGYGGSQLVCGVKDIFETIDGGTAMNQYVLQDMVKAICSTVGFDIVTSFATAKMADKALNEGSSMVGRVFRGYGTLGLDVGWSAAKIYNIAYPKLKGNLPYGASVTKPKRPNVGVGLIPY